MHATLTHFAHVVGGGGPGGAGGELLQHVPDGVFSQGRQFMQQSLVRPPA